MGKLTDTQIKNAPVKEKRYTLSDGDRLGLVIRLNGSKLWEMRYNKPFTKKAANISLGKYPSVSLKQARAKKNEINELLEQDIDPKEHRLKLDNEKNAEYSNTFSVYTDKWIELQSHSLDPETIKRKVDILKRHFLPSLGKVPISKITPKMVSDQLLPLKERGVFETIKKLLTSINQIMRMAKTDGVIDYNPISDLTKNYPTPKTKHHLTIRPDELPKLMSTIVNSNITRVTRCMIEWQIRTLARPGEAATARWEDIDLDAKLWTIPAEKMKMNKEHKVPLPPQLIEILKIAKDLNIGDSEYVFQGRDLRSHRCKQTANKALRDMGYKDVLVAHGLRALASTALNESELFDKDVIESALSHLDSDAVRRAYNRSEYLKQKETLLCWWSDFIDRASVSKNTIASSSTYLRAV